MNEDNILIIGDDVAGEESTIPTTPKEKTATGDESWLGGRIDALAEGFLQQHEAEFQDYERREREKLACAERFHSLQSEITNRRQWLATLQTDITDCRAVDIAADIFKNMQLTGRPLLDIAQSPLFSAAALIKEHGKKILQLAERELAELENKFDAFKEEKRETLKELGVT